MTNGAQIFTVFNFMHMFRYTEWEDWSITITNSVQVFDINGQPTPGCFNVEFCTIQKYMEYDFWFREHKGANVWIVKIEQSVEQVYEGRMGSLE